ncbi:uncharacterized protein NPIL_58561 [Nephila pilipes]|uniref:Uncharacterized protein n=1 Tax=Nephila pilipes TaxID=299642 RepID=A0A8X6U3P4_NEPPI|nr:uncharacterized protein NPIL_58561 [Nephila pilipes]
MALQVANFPSTELNNLTETRRLLSQLENDSSEISLAFKEWRCQRIKAIEAIGDIQKKLEKYESISNVGQSAGAGLAIAGKLAEIVLTLSGQKEAQKFLSGCDFCTTAGTITSVSSYLIGIGLTHHAINEVKEILKKDEKLTEPLIDTLKCSRTINKRFVRIFNCSILSDHFVGVIQLCNLCIQLLEEGDIDISRLIKNLKSRDVKNMNMLDFTETAIGNVCTTLQNMYTNQRMRSLLKEICNIILESPMSLKIVKVGLKLSLQNCNSNLAYLLSIGQLGTIMTRSNKAVLDCFLSAITFAWHVVTIVTSVNNIKNANQSENSKMLNDLKLALNVELNAVSKYSPLSNAV